MEVGKIREISFSLEFLFWKDDDGLVPASCLLLSGVLYALGDWIVSSRSHFEEVGILYDKLCNFASQVNLSNFACCGDQLVQSADNLLAMNAKFLETFPWFRPQSNNDLGQNFTPANTLEQPEHKTQFNVKLWGLSLLSLFPLPVNVEDKIQGPTTINRKLQRRSRSQFARNDDRVYPLRFRPYVSKVPWHTGVRGFLSQLFPRYGHYCGPNWSSGKDNGSLVWDKRPIDWLDFCCYCHDIGYDSHNQTELLKADLAFLECLERPHMITRGDARTAAIYKTMCINGMKNLLIPYRRHLIKLQSGESLVQFGWLSNVRWGGWNLRGTKN